jgi:signal transduction histidine kinase/streptogramin lyase
VPFGPSAMRVPGIPWNLPFRATGSFVRTAGSQEDLTGAIDDRKPWWRSGIDSEAMSRYAVLFLILTAPAAFAQQLLRPSSDMAAPLPSELSIMQLRHRAFTAANGAPMRAVDIAQDASGFLWFSTRSGLYRFDGVSFDQSLSRLLPSQMTQGLHAEPDGSLWVGYVFGGVSQVRGRQVTTYRDGIPTGTVFGFARTPDGTLWLASTSGLARFIDGQWSPAPPEMGLGPGSYEDIGTTPDGSLWVRINGDMFFLPAGGRHFQRTDLNTAFQARYGLPAYAARMASDLSVSPFMDSAGALWDFDADGIRRFRTTARGKPGEPYALERFGVAQGLTDTNVSAFFEDRDHNIWVSTALGVDQFRRSALTPIDFGVPVLNPTVAVDHDGTPWVGTIYGGVFKLGDDAQKQPALGEFVSCTTVDANGVIWMGGKGGLRRIERGIPSSIPIPEVVERAGTRLQAIAMDGNGALWVSWNSYGVFRRYKDNWESVENIGGLSTTSVMRLLVDEHQRLWLAFANGQIAVKDAAGTVQVYGPEEGLDVGSPVGLSVHGDEVLAAGDRGLAVLRHGRFLSIHSADDGAFSGVSGTVERGNGDIWLQSDMGVIRVQAEDIARAETDPGYKVKVDVLDGDDGLVGAAEKVRPVPSMVEAPNGLLWISTGKRLLWIDPTQPVPSATQPTPELTRIVADGRTVPLKSSVELPPGARILTIAFTAPTLSTPSHTRFRYKLDGFTDSWTFATNREVTFTNLDPGHYRLRVQAVGLDGSVSAVEAVQAVTLLPAFYQTTWFKLLVVALTMVLMATAYRFRIAYIKAASRATYRERERIAREIHDTLLQSTQGLLLAAQSAIRQPMEPETRRELTKALDLARLAAIEGRDRVSALRAGLPGDQCVLHQFLCDFPGRMINPHVDFVKLVDGRQRATQPQQGAELVAAVQEALFNATLHSRADVVRLKVAYRRRGVGVEVSDNGIGIDVLDVNGDGKQDHWGIRGMRERIEGIGGRIRLTSSKGAGTSVRITVAARHIYLRD